MIRAGFVPLSIVMHLPALPHIAKEHHTTSSLVQLSYSTAVWPISICITDLTSQQHFPL